MGANKPAGRLLQLLEAAKEYAHVHGGAKRVTVDTVLQSILSAPDDDRSALFQRFGQFLGMPALIRSKVLALPGVKSDLASAIATSPSAGGSQEGRGHRSVTMETPAHGTTSKPR